MWFPPRPVFSPIILPRTFSFRLTVPVALRDPKETHDWMFVTALLASSISMRQNKIADFTYAHGFHVHLSICPSVCLSVVYSIEPWIHHPIHLFIDAFVCYICPTLRLVKFLYRPLYEILEAVEDSTTRSAKHWFILPCESKVKWGGGVGVAG